MSHLQKFTMNKEYSKMQSNIIYTGNVMITIDNKNPKKKKNTGTKHLFAAITGFLGGLFNTPSFNFLAFANIV